MSGKDQEFSIPEKDLKKDGSKQESSNPVTKAAQTILEFTAAEESNPGPVVTKDLPAEEGTKEERSAKAKELNG